VVLDRNVLVSAAIRPHGSSARLVRAVRSGQLQLVVCWCPLDALAAVRLESRFRRWHAALAVVEDVEVLATVAVMRADPAMPAPWCGDPDDDDLIALAAPAGAVLVTGDRDLLVLDGESPPVRSPGALVDTRQSPPTVEGAVPPPLRGAFVPGRGEPRRAR